MKTLTVKQPWASLIVVGIKDVENRTWPTKFRGRVLIHASAGRAKKFKINLSDEQMLAAFKDISQQAIYGKFDFGAIIGSVEIVDCVINHSSIWAEKTDILTDEDGFPKYGDKIYNWVLANPILFNDPIFNVKGRLSFWDYELPIEYL